MLSYFPSRLRRHLICNTQQPTQHQQLRPERAKFGSSIPRSQAAEFVVREDAGSIEGQAAAPRHGDATSRPCMAMPCFMTCY